MKPSKIQNTKYEKFVNANDGCVGGWVGWRDGWMDGTIDKWLSIDGYSEYKKTELKSIKRV